MKYVKLLFVCMLLMVLMTGCQNKQVLDGDDKEESLIDETKEKKENKENKVYRTDELYEKQASGASFVAVKREKWDYVPENEEDDGTYYTYYEAGKTMQDVWTNENDIELPVELRLGEFAYVVADTTFITGGIDGRMCVEFKEIKECKKISLEEAVDLLEIPDFYQCESDWFVGCGYFGIHSKVDGFLMVGYMVNRYDYLEKKENSYEGEVIAYLQSKEIGRYNRLDFVGDYLVLYHHEGDENDLTLPENVTIETIEELLATEKQYNDFMFVLHKRDGAMTAYTRFLQGDRALLDESQTDMWYIPDFQDDMLQYEYTYLDVNADGSSELLVQLADDPCGYNGVFHYEEGRIYCWNSDSAEMSSRDYPLKDGIMVSQYDYAGTRTYTLFKYNADGSKANISTLLAREELHPEDSTEKCPYYAIDGIEVDKNEFDKKLNALVLDRLLERTKWISQ